LFRDFGLQVCVHSLTLYHPQCPTSLSRVALAFRGAAAYCLPRLRRGAAPRRGVVRHRGALPHRSSAVQYCAAAPRHCAAAQRCGAVVPHIACRLTAPRRPCPLHLPTALAGLWMWSPTVGSSTEIGCEKGLGPVSRRITLPTRLCITSPVQLVGPRDHNRHPATTFVFVCFHAHFVLNSASGRTGGPRSCPRGYPGDMRTRSHAFHVHDIVRAALMHGVC
jgi:hypothetical protein